MLSDDRESNSQNIGQATSTNIPPRPPSIPSGLTVPDQSAIHMLLDELLLEIFACYVEESQIGGAWHALACVCRRWRRITLGSPHRLNLRIFCSEKIPVRRNLDIWPPLPIVLNVDFHRLLGEDNTLATLERHDRVCQISIWSISRLLWEKALPLMQKPFPILTDLSLRYMDYRMASVIPDSFLGGSVPGLRKLYLGCIPFPGLPKLLLSATDLIHLELYEIPDRGYISADAIATCLSSLTRLELFMLCFESPRPHPEWERRRTSSSTRTTLPFLTNFTFKGVSEYLEDIVDRIEVPLLAKAKIRFHHQPTFDTTRLTHFIGRIPKLKTCNEASIRLSSWHASVKVSNTNASLLLEDWLQQPGFQLSPLKQLCASSFPQSLISTVGRLIIVGMYFDRPPGQDGDSSLWRELLQPFVVVKDLYLSPDTVTHIALALQEPVGQSVMELLPVLQNIFLKELEPSRPATEGIKQFVAARQLANHPISVFRWEIT